MTAVPPAQMREMRENGQWPDLSAESSAQSLSRQWIELHQTAARLASVALLAPEPFDAALAGFPARLAAADQWQQEMAQQGIADIDAMMRPGLRALDVLTERGQDASVPALALWREFHHARAAVLALTKTI